MKLISRASAFLALCGLLSATSTAQTPAVFHPGEQFATGLGPRATAVGDLDMNGSPDIVVADQGANHVSVLLSTAPASFPQTTIYSTGNMPESVAIGNLNGDSIRDIATANGDGTVTVLLGTPGAPVSFGAPTTVASSILPQSIALEDLNGDSISDLVTLKSGTDGVWVQLGTGTGGFGAPTFYGAGPTLPPGLFPYSILIRDMNGDSKPDIVTANTFWNSVSVLLGTGTGSFAMGQAYPVGSAPLPGAAPAIAIGDLNEDGHQDVVVLIYGGPNASVSVLLGTGSGALGAGTIIPFPGTDPSYCVKLGDLNRDGHSDLVMGNSDVGSVDVALGTGTGSFGVASSVAAGDMSVPVTVADVNGDTKADLVLASPGSNNITVRLNANPDMSGIPWTYLGHGLAGTGDQMPLMNNSGSLTVGSSTSMGIASAKPNSLVYFFVGLDPDFLPFKSGVMVPAPTLRVGPFITNGSGNFNVTFTWKWPGLKICTQAWIQDAGAPMGWSATNAIQLAGQ